MSDKEMDSLLRYVREYVREQYFNDTDSTPPPQRQPPATDKDILEPMNLIRQGLERYRTEPPESNIRKVIDSLIRAHGNRKGNGNDRAYKARHNALVLEYLIAQPMSQRQIMLRLGMSMGYETYKSQLEKGISELAYILFG